MRVHRNPLKRFYGRGDLHFVTFSCYRRRPYLGTAQARDLFVEILDEERVRYEFALIGYVLIPEHVHLLVSEPERGDLSKVLQALKQRVSRALRSGRESGIECTGGDTRALWQPRFYDFNVWSKEKVREKLIYMHRNPVERKLVSDPKDWPWSSWSYYAKGERGLIGIDLVDQVRERDNHDVT